MRFCEQLWPIQYLFYRRSDLEGEKSETDDESCMTKNKELGVVEIGDVS